MVNDLGDTGYASYVIVAKGRRQKAEGGRRKAEGGRQKAEGRRRKAAMPFLFLALSLWVEFSVEFQYSKGVFRA
jgi:nitrate reductase NapE component